MINSVSASGVTVGISPALVNDPSVFYVLEQNMFVFTDVCLFFVIFF